MRADQIHERTRVAAVTVESEDGPRTHHDCWVSIRQHDQQVYVWLDKGDREPDLLLPLARVTIHWAGLPRRLGLDD
jgi:hypothetical protein